MQPLLPFERRTENHEPPTPHPIAEPRTPHPIAEPRTPHPNPEPRTSHQNAEPRTLNPEPVFVRHPRARRYVIRVAADGTVRVTVPRWGSKREAAAFAQREHAWIEKQQRRVDEERRQRQAHLGSALLPAVERALLARAKLGLAARLLELAAHHGLTVSRVSVRNQRWRWGSCSRSGHICLNWRLAQMPDPVRDYVMIHELMHLKRMDHSPRFWKLVAAACPDYEIARRWLRAHGRPHNVPFT